MGVERQTVPAIEVHHKTMGVDSDVEEEAINELPGCHPSVSVN